MWVSVALGFTFLAAQCWRLAVARGVSRRAVVAAYFWAMATFAWLTPSVAVANGFLLVAALPFLRVYWHILQLRQRVHEWRV